MGRPAQGDQREVVEGSADIPGTAACYSFALVEPGMMTYRPDRWVRGVSWKVEVSTRHRGMSILVTTPEHGLPTTSSRAVNPS